jgi:hypothetical protein
VLNYDFIEMHPAFGVPTNGRWRFVDNVTLRRQADIELDLQLKELGYTWTPEQIAKKYDLEAPEVPEQTEPINTNEDVTPDNQ